MKYVVCRSLTTKTNKNSKFGKSRSKCQKKNIFLKKSCRGIGPRVRYTKNQLPRQKTLAKNVVRNVTIFRPEKTKKMAYCKTGFFRGILIFAVFAVRPSSAKIKNRENFELSEPL